MKGDKNNIFFNMIHYILSEQANVDWILKSSFINFTGLQTEVSFSKFQKPNLVDDILEYITHIKPYHTKFDQFIEKYTSKNDKVKIQGDRKEATDGSFIVIHNLVEFFNVTERIRFDNVTLDPDIELYNNLPNTKTAERKFWETTSANRLYANTTKDLDRIKDILRGGFKGLTLNGGEFLIDSYGYEAKPYDTTLYDAPNITNFYYIVNHTEPEYSNYKKYFINAQNNLLKTNHPYALTREKTKIYSYYNDVRTEIREYNIIGDIINIFRGIEKYEKIVVTVSEQEENGSITRYNYIFVGVNFREEVSDSGVKEFAEYGNLTFKIPDADYGIKTMRVYSMDTNGTKLPITNYIKNGQYITLTLPVPEFYTVSISIIDYSYIYDRIYAYEDVYASQNNLMYLDGEGFLRPHWDCNHPSELTISRPLDSAFICKYDEDGKPKDQLFIDSLRDTTYSDWDSGEHTILTKELKIGDRQIHVKNAKLLEQPKIDENGVKTPGVICIGNEIIEFYGVEKNTLFSIKRATRGSSFKVSYPKGTMVWDYASNNTIKQKNTFYSIGYTADTDNLSYLIPGDIDRFSVINVYKNQRVRMLDDLTPDSEYVNFDKPILNTTNEIKLIYKPENFFKVAKGNEIGVKLGEINDAFVIHFSEDITTLEDLTNYINENVPPSYEFNAKVLNDSLVFTSGAGNSILLYNADGYPVQEIFDSTMLGTVINPTVLCNGTNGIIVNGFKTVWGNYAHTIKWLKENPYTGDINECVLSINNNRNLKNKVLARNNENRLEIVSLDGKPIEITMVGDTTLEDLGLKSIQEIPEIIQPSDSFGSLIAFQEKAQQAGSVVINGETVYFYIYNEYIDQETGALFSRIEDIRTIANIKADEAIITTPAVYELNEGSDYIIEGNKIVLTTPPQDFEAIYITNNIITTNQ